MRPPFSLGMVDKTPMDVPGNGSTLHSPHILLVEDGPDELYLLSKAFTTGPFPVHLHSVPSVKKALAFLRRTGPYAQVPRPHLILTSINLPGQPGFDLISEVKGDFALHPIPVIVFSTYDNPAIIQKSYELGANSYLTKPRDYEAYCKKIHTLMEYWLRVVRLSPLLA